MTLSAEIRNRIQTLQSKLDEQGLEGALLVHPVDIYYFSGTRQNAVLHVPTRGSAVLLVRKSLIRARAESGLEDVRPFPPSREFANLFEHPPATLGMCFDVTPVQQLGFYQKLLPNTQFSDISLTVRQIRSVKSPHELALMRQSAERLCRVFDQVPGYLKPGMRELDVSAQFEYLARREGNEGYIRMRAFNQELFQGLALGGDSASHPGFFDGAVTGRGLSAASPQGASTAAIEKEQPVMLDYTAVHDGYIVDMTRIFVFDRVRPEVQKAFDTALFIQDHLERNMRPGRLCGQLFDESLQIARDHGLEDCFMGVPGENARFVAHGVGLELDEMPVLAKGFDAPLIEGQTLAVEPKFVLPGIGVVGIENTYVVTPKGGERLTCRDDAIRVL